MGEGEEGRGRGREREKDLVDSLMWRFVFHTDITYEIITYLNCYQKDGVAVANQTGVPCGCLQQLERLSPLT